MEKVAAPYKERINRAYQWTILCSKREEALRVLKVIPGYTVQFKICLAESYESKDMSLPEFFNEFMKQSAEKMEGQNEQ